YAAAPARTVMKSRRLIPTHGFDSRQELWHDRATFDSWRRRLPTRAGFLVLLDDLIGAAEGVHVDWLPVHKLAISGIRPPLTGLTKVASRSYPWVMYTIGLKILKNKLSEYVRLVAAG